MIATLRSTLGLLSVLVIALSTAVLWPLAPTRAVGPPLPLPTLNLGTPLPTLNLGTPLPTLNLGTPLPTIDLGTPLPTIDLGTPLPTPRPSGSRPSASPSPRPEGAASGASEGPLEGPGRPGGGRAAGPGGSGRSPDEPAAVSADPPRLVDVPTLAPLLPDVGSWLVPALGAAVPALIVALLVLFQLVGGAAAVGLARARLGRIATATPSWIGH